MAQELTWTFPLITFKQLATLAALDETTSRTRLTELLADLVRRVPLEAMEQVVYVIEGRVSPGYDAVELALGERAGAQSIAHPLRRR